VGRLAPADRRARLVAAVGPCIGPCCFEVGRDVALEIAGAAGAGVIAAERGDKAYVDLRAAVRAQLALAGVAKNRIDDVAGCTKHEAARFHSFRRDGKDSGRMLASIAVRRTGAPGGARDAC
jgi:copper oxidase (laccase) domain-containing protein